MTLLGTESGCGITEHLKNIEPGIIYEDLHRRMGVRANVVNMLGPLMQFSFLCALHVRTTMCVLVGGTEVLCHYVTA